MKTRLQISLAAGVLAIPLAHAGSRSSTNYSVAADIADTGGRRITSASYTSDGSAGGAGGVSTVSVPAETARHGYIGQLFEVSGLALNASPTTLNETQTRQLSAAQLLNDASQITVNASSVSWSVLNGPIASISPGGLVTAGNVYQNTSASVQGLYQGFTGMLGLTVVNVGLDDFGAYAGDGLPDDWQVQYFGIGNTLAAPAQDPDVDGHTNLFEYIAGTLPNNSQSVFKSRVDTVPVQPNQLKIIFSPRLSDRTYVVQYRVDLVNLPDWATLTGTSQSDNGQERTVTDLNAIGQKFYRVQVTKP